MKVYSAYRLNIILAAFLFITCMCLSCKKLVQVDAPVTTTNSENVYKTDATATAVLTGIYANMSASQLTAGTSLNSFMSMFAGLSADELIAYPGASANYLAYYKNTLSSTITPNIWTYTYPVIYIANAALQGLENSNALTPAVKQQLIGEAKFMRAFAYFYVTNLYGDVPLATGTDYKSNSELGRSPLSTIYQQIVDDLISAQTLLSSDYLDIDLVTKTTERIRPNKSAAAALLSRVYLYTGNWAGAEMQASSVINNSMYDTVPLNQVFLMNSNEAIWQLQPVNTGWNTEDARVFVLPSSGVSGARPVYLSNFLMNSFEAGDKRAVLNNWVKRVTVGSNTYNFPFKYKSATLNSPLTEYQMVLRLGEQYLIRAEARAQQNKIAEAKADLNVIRQRAGLANTDANTKDALLTAILHERQVELFTEWGHRWLDLKRTRNADAVMSVVTPQKGGTWDPKWKLYPIGATELQSAPNLSQNDGY